MASFCNPVAMVPYDSLSGQLGAWLRDSRCLKVRLRGLGFVSAGNDAYSADLLRAIPGCLGSWTEENDDCRKDASDTDQDQGNYQGVSKEVFY